MNKNHLLLCLLLLAGALIAISRTITANPAGAGAAPPRQIGAAQAGGKIAFVSFREPGGSGDIYFMEADGSRQTRLTDHPANDVAPVWSPDGSLIAFQSDRDNIGSGRPDIYVMNADGSNVRRLTTHPADDEAPEWSPDGTKIAFNSSRDDRPGGVRQLYVMNADGSGQTRLTFGNSVQPKLSWSPDGSKIAFASFDGPLPDINRIFTINVSNGTVSPLTSVTLPETHNSPDWSPDGRQLAFTRSLSGAGGSAEVYVVNADGSSPRNLTNNSVDDSFPEWSPDGSAIAFQSFRDGPSEIYWMYPDGSGQTNLTKNAAADFSPSWQTLVTDAPWLLAEEGTEHAVALDSVTLMRDPFNVVTTRNFSSDNRTRVTLFARNVKLLPGDDAAAVTAQAVDEQQRVHPLVVEHIGRVPGFSWLTQVTIKLPEELIGAGDVRVSISLHGSASNQVFFSIIRSGSSP
jgi:Tol biopolymer transport system component